MDWLTDELPGFCGGTLDRVDHVRSDPDALARAFGSPDARVVLLEMFDPVIDGDMLARAPVPYDARLTDYVLLGLQDGVPLFAQLVTGLISGMRPSPRAWKAASLLSPDEAAIYATARSLVDWHSRHGFCAVCGNPTRTAKGGWSRACGHCNAEHFPRVDPVTIMLPEHDGRVLVGRQPRFAPGSYSALAGFVEPGETIEQAVMRELHEEAGIRAFDVRYVVSQPWPFPSSMMIGCMAKARDAELTIDRTELEDAMWVTADQVRAAMQGDPSAGFILPPKTAVAWHLFAHWLREL